MVDSLLRGGQWLEDNTQVTRALTTRAALATSSGDAGGGSSGAAPAFHAEQPLRLSSGKKACYACRHSMCCDLSGVLIEQ